MDTQEILFKKTHVTPVTPDTPINYVAIITIFDNLSKVSKRPVRITSVLKAASLIITMPGPVPYKSDKTKSRNYGGIFTTMASNKTGRPPKR